MRTVPRLPEWVLRGACVLAPPLCVGCGADAGTGEPLCADCRGGLRWLGADPGMAEGLTLWAPLAYESASAAIVRALKFRGATRLASTMAAQIAANAPPGLLERTVLVPVPLHPSRRRRRGFNQAECLAEALAARAGLALADCLRRYGPAATQVGRGRAERLAALAGTVRLRPGAVAPRAALLVDDVATTGATLAACADALRASGTERIAAVTYARTPGR